MLPSLALLGSLLALGVSAAVPAADNQTYEYIVVGSGPGGGPLAANLARAGHSVLLLEAGDDQGDSVNVTKMENFLVVANDEKSRWDFFVKHTDNDSDYEFLTWRKPDGGFYVGLEPPKNSTKLGVWYPRTGTLGGCAIHNGAVATIPNDRDWDYIANVTGDATWKAKAMRKHYISLEKSASINASDATHGHTGWLDISNSPTAWAKTDADARVIAENAANATGALKSQLPGLLDRDINADDPNRDNTLGLFGSWSHSKDGIRSSPNNYIRSTLRDAKKFPLTLQLHSLVSKVLFDKNQTDGKPKAIGVEYLQGNYLYAADPRYDPSKNKGVLGRAYATKEVIIAGGAFNSPQILKLSGIGPAAELKKFNIPVVVDAPGVGERLADNYEGSVRSFAARDFKGASDIFFAFLKSPAAEGTRDLQAWCGQFSFDGFWPGFPKDYGLKQYECTWVHMNPRSQEGYVRLRSADPTDVPDINLKFWEKGAEQDLTAMHEGVRFAREILKNAPNGLGPFKEQHPCPKEGGCTLAEEKEYLKKQVYSHHATSTCAIGADGDKWAVLDSKFKVRGVKGLRVVDASAFPKVPGAFPVIPTMMLSEKASAEILAGN